MQTRRVKFATKHWGLDKLKTLDIGCGSGNELQYFGKGSVGLEGLRTKVETAKRKKLNAIQWNIMDPLPASFKNSFETVWCSNVFEHVLSPHRFLMEVRKVLIPEGLFIAIVPCTRSILKIRPWTDYLAADHINFFTAKTLRLTVERAGFKILFLGSPSFPHLPLRMAKWLTAIAPHFMVAARIIHPFQYPQKAHKILVNGNIIFKE